MLVKVADCYALDAEKNFEAGKGRKLISSALFETAIQAYRKIPSKFRDEYAIDQRISDLRHQLNSAGKNALNQMGVINTPIDNAEEIVKLSEEHVAGKSTEYEALIYLSGVCPVPDYTSLENQEKENAKKFFFTSLFASSQYSSDGRIIAKTPSAGLGDDKEAGDAVLRDAIVRSFNYELSYNSRLLILPALNQILREHTISRRFIFELCGYSPIVPKENINLISKGIWLGFELDFSSSIHLLAPQVEKIIRVQLKSNSVHTTHLDEAGIEHEKGLSALLDMPEAEKILGTNLLFELKAIFTDSIGPNLRNEVAHGLLTDRSASSDAPIYAWWMVLRMIIHSVIDSSENN
jgi:hypothetical protein